jgi:hypothetical protein
MVYSAGTNLEIWSSRSGGIAVERVAIRRNAAQIQRIICFSLVSGYFEAKEIKVVHLTGQTARQISVACYSV